MDAAALLLSVTYATPGIRDRSYRLTPDGLQRMIDAGFDLVTDAAQYCSYHARSEAERYEMQSRGGSFSQRRAAEVKEEKIRAALDARDTTPREHVVAAQALARQLLNARLPGTRETDMRKACVGVLLAAHLYKPPEDHQRLFNDLQAHIPRDVYMRGDWVQVAEQELRDMINELPEDERHLVWETLNAHS